MNDGTVRAKADYRRRCSRTEIDQVLVLEEAVGDVVALAGNHQQTGIPSELLDAPNQRGGIGLQRNGLVAVPMNVEDGDFCFSQ